MSELNVRSGQSSCSHIGSNMNLGAVLWSVCIVSCLGLPPPLNITRLETKDRQCQEDLNVLRRGLESGQLWANTIIDAGVISPVGVLSQTAVHFGDFDACLGLKGAFDTQFCFVDILPFAENDSHIQWTPIKLGSCLPASCQPLDLQTSIQHLMDCQDGRSDKVKVLVKAETCTTSESRTNNLSALDIIFLVFVGSVAVLLAASTLYDMVTSDGASSPQTLVQCFSIRHGWHSLFRPKEPPCGLNLQSFHGIHVFAVFFIILGHRFGIHLCFMTLTNYKDVEKMFAGHWFSIWAGHMDLFVDMFFFMSSFLLAVLYLVLLDNVYVAPWKVYLNRLTRLVPGYFVVVFFYATWLRHIADGPIWNMYMDGEMNNCVRYWWTNALFINNYVEADHICLPQSWYLSCDFQLFVVGTLLVLLMHKYFDVGIAVSLALLILSSIAVFYGTFFFDRPAIMIYDKSFWTNPRNNDMFSSVYSQGHYRVTSYLPGIFAGVYVHRRRSKPITEKLTYILQVTGLAIILGVYFSGSLFYKRPVKYSRLAVSLYAATFHQVFGLGLAILAITFTVGYSTPFTNIWSWRGFLPLGKLTYNVYLVHFIFPFVWLASSRTAVYLNPIELVSWTIADMMLSLVVALVIYLSIETPCRYLITYITKLGSGSRMSKDIHTQETTNQSTIL